MDPQTSQDTRIQTPFDWRKPVISMFGALIIGVAGSYLASLAGDIWYTEIKSGNLPLLLSKAVWIAMSVLAGFSFYRIWEKGMGVGDRRAAVWVFVGIQLALNPIWSGVGSSVEGPFLSIIKAVISIAAVVWVLLKFSSRDRLAGIILWPYLIWVGVVSIPGLAMFFSSLGM